MTVNAIWTVWCEGDGCGEWIVGDTRGEARQIARRNGWSTSGGLDLCPQHKQSKRSTDVPPP